MKMIWNFSGFTKVLKSYFSLYKVEIDKQIFIQEINAFINNQMINSMFKTDV